jgi:hypothetical protein
MYVIQHCFICRPSDFTVLVDATTGARIKHCWNKKNCQEQGVKLPKKVGAECGAACGAIRRNSKCKEQEQEKNSRE